MKQHEHGVLLTSSLQVAGKGGPAVQQEQSSLGRGALLQTAIVESPQNIF